jgi:hypothetical protein
MEDQACWQVNIGSGVGPIVLGDSPRQILESLAGCGFQADFDSHVSETLLRIPRLKLKLVFAADGSQTLRRIDIQNPRVSFADWDVIGKPIHKAVRLFKCAEQETLWCSSYDQSLQSDLVLNLNSESPTKCPGDVDLLRRGTLWIPPLGLGFTLKEGRIDELHVTKPEHAPRQGTATWNLAQKTMSELGRIPKRDREFGKVRSTESGLVQQLLTAALVVALGFVAWGAIDLQRRWNAQSDVPATVTAVIPPPPAPFGDQFALRYVDEAQRTHEVTMERMDFFEEPKLNTVVKLRYLPESPDQPLGDRRLVDVGMNYGIPRAGYVVAAYALLTLIFSGYRWLRMRME